MTEFSDKLKTYTVLDLKNIRQEYSKHELKNEDLSPNPIDQFKKWYQQAITDKNIEPNAMTLSTIGIDQTVNSRIVLLKEVINQKFRFFTNYTSEKGKDITHNSNVALLFFWANSEKQIRIKGKASKCAVKDSEDYFYSRPAGSQAGAIASHQSEVLSSKDELIYRFEKIKNNQELKKPENWGGYDIEPTEIEFWQGGKNRLHDRFRYTLENGTWVIDRLSP